VIGDRDFDVVSCPSGADGDARFLVARAVFQRIVHEVDDRLAQQFAASRHGKAGLRRRFQRHALLFRDGLVHFDDVVHHGVGVEDGEIVARIARLCARDHEQGVEDADEAVRLLDDRGQRLAMFSVRRVLAQGRLGAVSQARERRLEVMSDIVGDLAQTRHQLRDALEHRVEIFRESVKFVAGAAHREALIHVARHDAARRGGHEVDPLQHPMGDEQSAEGADQHEPEKRYSESAAQDVAQHLMVFDVVADQQSKAAGDEKETHQGGMNLAGLSAPLIRHLDKIPPAAERRGGWFDIADNDVAGMRHQQIERTAGGAHAALDGGRELAQAALGILLGERADFRIHRLRDLLVEHFLHARADARQHKAGADREQQKIGDRELERGRAKELADFTHGQTSKSFLLRRPAIGNRRRRDMGVVAPPVSTLLRRRGGLTEQSTANRRCFRVKPQ